ncbi:hypothetical protein RGU72_12955 [Undibacterium sp. 5I1]|uniref:hypothetical protein n=1 Tax=unclassified Undibacterium TaxID=2630295 RepID=UPI002AB50355|nr:MULTISPECIES: hypothetical protein [unclassified Undibacterium]MDY7539162.1 hypothetical protein [Undibacterium sp. 5I1]MEB0232410.1 hypothetical protein [Undibacterium sp. 10I3]
MAEITAFLADPLVSLLGYILTVISGFIAIWQSIGKSRALTDLQKLKVQIDNSLQNSNNLSETVNQNHVQQGPKSQYFQENKGSINIDNRG